MSSSNEGTFTMHPRYYGELKRRSLRRNPATANDGSPKFSFFPNWVPTARCRCITFSHESPFPIRDLAHARVASLLFHRDLFFPFDGKGQLERYLQADQSA